MSVATADASTTIEEKPPFKKTEPMAYAMGDIGNGFYFQLVTNYALIYMTDALGINPLWAGWIIFVGKLISAFTDFGTGVWADNAPLREVGYFMILLLAGLQTIPAELYEAAKVDGANAWERFWHITVPCMRPTLFSVTVTLTITSLKILDLTLVMTNGGPGTSTLVLAQYVYRVAFERADFGYASTVSLALFFICLAVTLVQFWYNNAKEK